MFDFDEERHYAYPNETILAKRKEFLDLAFAELKLSQLLPDDEWRPLRQIRVISMIRPELASWIYAASGQSEASREKRMNQDSGKKVELGAEIAVKQVLAVHVQQGLVVIRGSGDEVEYRRVPIAPLASPALNADPQPATDQPTDRPGDNQPAGSQPTDDQLGDTTTDTSSATPSAPPNTDTTGKSTAAPPPHGNRTKSTERCAMLAVARMNDALIAEFEEILCLFTDADSNDMKARYEIAAHCERVRAGEGNGGTYGQRATVLLAEALGLKKSTIYNYANVARTWPEKKAFDGLTRRRRKHRRALNWSHILILATVADPDRRETLITQTLAEGWSAQELKSNIKPKRVPSQPGPLDKGGTAGNDIQGEAKRPRMPRVLEVPLEAIEVQIDALQTNMESFGTQFDHGISDADPTDLSPSLLDRLKQARRKLEEHHQANVKRFDTWITQVETRRSSQIRSQDEWDNPSLIQQELHAAEEHPVHTGPALMAGLQPA